MLMLQAVALRENLGGDAIDASEIASGVSRSGRKTVHKFNFRRPNSFEPTRTCG